MKSKQHFLFVSVLHECLNKVIARGDTSTECGLKAVMLAIIRVQEEAGVCISSLFQSGSLYYYERQAPAVLSDVAQCAFFLEFALVIEDA